MIGSIVVGTDGSDTAKEAVRQATELAKALGASVHLVSAYEPIGEGRLREERQQIPDDMQWMVNPARGRGRDPARTPAAAIEEAGARGRDLRARGRSGGRDPRRRRGAERRPDHRGQQGDDRREAVPTRQRPEQGVPSRALQRDDHPDYLAERSRPRRPGRGRSGGRTRPVPGRRAVRRRCDGHAAPGSGSLRAARWRSPARRSLRRGARPSRFPGSRREARTGAGCGRRSAGRCRGRSARGGSSARRAGCRRWSASLPPPGATMSRPLPEFE